ncbi:hypothetical protein TKK_0006013 [Trichogramma kaykai]
MDQRLNDLFLKGDFNYWLNLFLRATFLSPIQSRTVKIIGRTVISSSFIFSTVITLLRVYTEMQKEILNAPLLAEIVFQFITVAGVLIFYVQCASSDYLIHKVSMIITYDKEYVKNKTDERRIILNVVKQGSRLILVHFVLIPSLLLFGMAPIFLPPLLNHFMPGNETYERALCIHVELFINQDDYFYELSIFALYMLSLVSIIICSMDLAFTNCLSYIIGIYDYIGFALENLKPLSRETHTDKENEEYIVSSIQTLVKRHHKCLELCDCLNDIAATKLFIVMIGFATVLSISGSMAVVEISYDPTSSLRMLIAFVLIIVIVLIISHPGQLLIDASKAIYFKCYCSWWYEYPVKARKLLLTMMIRSAIPSRMRIGPQITLNLETAGIIIKTALSYVTALISVCS